MSTDILQHHLYILVHVWGRHDTAGHIRVLVHHIHTVLLARAAGASCADITRKLYFVTNWIVCHIYSYIFFPETSLLVQKLGIVCRKIERHYRYCVSRH